MAGFCILNGEIEKISTLKTAPIFVLNDAEKEDIRLYDTKPLCIGLHIQNLIARLQRTAERQILIRKHRVELLEQRLAACNPERIYKMGYSLLTKNGKVIHSITELQSGDIISTHLSDGHIESSVL